MDVHGFELAVHLAWMREDCWGFRAIIVDYKLLWLDRPLAEKRIEGIEMPIQVHILTGVEPLFKTILVDKCEEVVQQHDVRHICVW
ncbi:hypothetical protein D9M68_883290 [compost metagenome]